MTSKKPPFDPDKLYQRALSLHHTGKLSEAESLYKTLLSYFPDQTELLTTLGTLLFQQGRHEEGLKQLKKSLSIAPNQPAALYNLGVELQKQIKLEDALVCYDQAITLNPNDVMLYINRGNTLRDLKRFPDALASYDRAIALNPDAAPAYWNKAMLKILLGEYEEGWRLYEWGIKCGKRKTLGHFSQPQWLGEQPIFGKTLLIQAEQGLGDMIQFCRYAPLVEALGAKVILETPASLVSLLSTLKGNIAVIEKGHELPEFDMVCPVMSLPLAFRTTVETIPATVPYLAVNQEQQAKWRQHLGTKTKPRVGLVWSGSMSHENDLNRSIPLKSLLPLLQLPLEFHSLQKEIRPSDEEAQASFHQLHTHQNALNDFSDTAALIQEMDLVITVDTSVVHLAGAIGHPTWVLLPYSPDYRWMLDRTDSPWYQTVNLIRQPEIGNWSSVISNVTRQLEARFMT